MKTRKTCPFLCHSTLDLGRDPLIRGKQVMEIKHTLKEPRSLADPVLTAGYTKELHLRDVCWKQANSKFHACMLCAIFTKWSQVIPAVTFLKFIGNHNFVLDLFKPRKSL